MDLKESDLLDRIRLQARFDELKAVKKMRPAEFAREFNFPGGSTMITHHLHGKSPISAKAAIAYARGFGCAAAEISTRLASVISANPLAYVQPTQHALSYTPEKPPQDQSVEYLMEGLASYLSAMDTDSRKDAAYALSRLAESPHHHARHAALIKSAFHTGQKKQA